jgi:hypothetical protein
LNSGTSVYYISQLNNFWKNYGFAPILSKKIFNVIKQPMRMTRMPFNMCQSKTRVLGRRTCSRRIENQ